LASNRADPARDIDGAVDGRDVVAVVDVRSRPSARPAGRALLGRAWQAGAGPGPGPGDLVIDVDSTVCEVHGYAKQGAAYGYTRTLGYDPLLARVRRPARSCTRGSARGRRTPRAVRSGSCVRPSVGASRGRGRPAHPARGRRLLSHKVIGACRDHDVRYSITVRQTKPVVAAIDGIDETAWIDIVYPDGARRRSLRPPSATTRG